MKLIATVRKANKKDIKIAMGDNSIEAMVESRRWPPGGLPDLQRAVENELPWVTVLTKAATPLTIASYARYMQLMGASLYSFSPQGRVQAVEDFKYGQFRELIREKFVLSNMFKTMTKFGYQPITTNDISSELLSYYVSVIRPKTLCGANDPMFVSFTGTGTYSMRSAVTAFFRRTLNLHITTTSIRSLVETTMHSLQVIYTNEFICVFISI